jgi:hypothetical protein
MIGRIASLLKMRAPEPALVTGKLFDHGVTVPADGSVGYETGCLFQHIDGGAGTALYVNEGTLASSNFDAVTVA